MPIAGAQNLRPDVKTRSPARPFKVKVRQSDSDPACRFSWSVSEYPFRLDFSQHSCGLQAAIHSPIRETGGGVTQQRCPPIAKLEGTRTLQFFKPQRRAFMALKPGPKPIAKSTGKPDQRRR